MNDSYDRTDRFRVTVRMKSGGTLELGTFDTLGEAVAAADEFKEERDDVKWTVKQRTMGEAKHSFVAAIGFDGVTDPSIVVTRVEAKAARRGGSSEWYAANKRGREL
jgi:hypothetical protein